MKLRKRIAAMGAAMVMAVNMMSVGASASTPYYWTLDKQYNQPISTVTCTGYVYNLTTTNDDAIDFICTYESNTNSDVRLDIIHNMKLNVNQKADLFYVKDTDQIKFKNSWYSTYVANGYKCQVTGELINCIATTYTASGKAS